MKFDTMFTAIKYVMIAAWLLSFTPASFAMIDDDAPHPINPPQTISPEERSDINIYEEYCPFGDVFRTDCSSIINAAIEKIPAPMRDDVLRDFAPFCHKWMRPEKRVELLENLAKLSPSKREMFTQLFRTHLHKKRKFLASETLLSLSNVSEENMEDIIKRVAKAHQNCKYFLKFLIESWSELPTPEARDDVDSFLATTKIEGLRSQYYKLAIAMEAPP